MQQSIANHQPWMLPWWKPYGKGNGQVLAYLVGVHILALLAVAGVFVFGLPNWKVAFVTVTFILFGSLSTTLGYHRSLTHKAVKLHPIVEQFLIFGAVFNGSGVPSSWVSNHRCHHFNSDTIDDVSSPRYGGFWWAHLRWLYQWEQSDIDKWAPDMAQPKYLNWAKWQPVLIVISLSFGYFVGGLLGMLWIGAFRMVFCLHGQCFVNSLLHLKPGLAIGVQSARNIWWLGPLQTTAWGENWHQNHHESQAAANFGRNKWQVDIAWYIIKFLRYIGLASEVNVFKDGRMQRLG
jgi:fatty-acid desaturase